MAATVKKFVAGFMIVGLLFAALGMSACGNSSAEESNPLEGTWNLSAIELDGKELPEDEYKQYTDSMGDNPPVIVVDADGKVNITMQANVIENGSFTLEDGKGTISSPDNSVNMGFTLDGNKLKVDSSGTVLVFTK